MLTPEPRPPRAPRVSEGAPSTWTAETIETLSSLWAEGLSASQIADRLGVTRNAVIGKVHRLGLAGRPPRPRAARPAKQKPLRSGRPTRGPSPRPRLVGEPELPARPCDIEDLPGEATLMTLGAHMCRWPIGDPAREEFRLCGRGADAGPYCAHHARLAYVAPRTRSASNTRLMDSLRRVL